MSLAIHSSFRIELWSSRDALTAFLLRSIEVDHLLTVALECEEDRIGREDRKARMKLLRISLDLEQGYASAITYI